MDQNTVWVIAIAALIIGALIGFLFGRSGSDSSREVRLADELDKAQSELNQYRADVNKHFSTTADLVNNLTQQYQRVHEHLADSASKLCRDEKLVASLKPTGALALNADMTKPEPSKTEADTPDKAPQVDAEVEPIRAPLDYAPRNSAEEPGTLSDKFGLADKPKAEEQTPDPTRLYDVNQSKSA